MRLEVTVRDKIDELIASYPNHLQFIYEHMAQLLAAMQSQHRAIKETIENDIPCSESLLREIASG